MLHVVRFLAAICLALAVPAAAAAQDYKTWYLAEGSTGFFEEEILIANPNAVAANVTIQYVVPSGFTAPAPKQLVVAATSRKTVKVNDDITIHAVSAVVTSDQPIVVERSLYWGTGRLGGHNTVGVQAPQMEWFLAEGVSNAIFDEFILIANPNNVAVEVQIDYLGTDGIKDTDTYTVAANSRRTIHAAVDLDTRFGGRFRNRTFSAKVKSLTAANPIIVERSIYWGGIFAAGLNPGGTNEAGVATLSSTWRFGEGYAGGTFQTFLLIANPGETAVTVDTTFYLEDGSTTVDTRTLPPNSRTNIWVNAEIGPANAKAFSAVVRAQNGGLVAAERAMYWGGFREGHVVAGTPNEAAKWGFAEGLEDRFGGVAYDTYFLLNNAGNTEGSVKVTFLLEDGTGFSDTFPISAQSRKTLHAGGLYPQLSNRRFAAFFESSVPIVAERAVYWGAGYYGGHASAGVALPNDFVVGTPAAVAGPTVTSIAPAYGYTSGGTDVTIKGTNFTMGATVTFGGVNAVTSQVFDAETIIARTPGHAAGAVAVTVTSNGQNATSATNFTYEVEPPPPPPPTSGTSARGAPVAIYCDAFANSGVCNHVVTWPFPQNAFGIINQLAIERRDLLVSSCHETGGNNNFMFEAVRRLRSATGSNRWGLNIKRGNQGLSQDIVTYFYGPEGTEMEGDIRVYIFDIIGGHCGGNPGPNWEDVTEKTRAGGTIGRWTTAGRNF